MHRLLCRPTTVTAAALTRTTTRATRQPTLNVRFLTSNTTPPTSISTSTADSEEFSDRCSLHVVQSPFPPIAEGPYPPLYEFVTENWLPHGGSLDEKVAIIDGSTGMQRTFRDYYTTTGGLAGALRYDFDVAENDCVALFSPNHVDYAPIVLAVALCGAKITPVNPMYTNIELEKVLERSRSKVLIAHRSTLETALVAARHVKSVKHVVVITDDDTANDALPEGTIHLDYLRQHGQAFDSTVHEIHRKTATHPLCLPYSSGTTGLPKGVCLTHSNIAANLLQLEVIEGLPFAESFKLISPLPFFHIYAFTVSMLYPAWKGQTVITTSGRFNLEQFCQLVQEFRPERAHLVPPILVGLAKHPVVDQYDLSSLKCILSAAAPLSTETETTVKERLGGACEVKQGWVRNVAETIGEYIYDGEITIANLEILFLSFTGHVGAESHWYHQF